MLITPAPKRYIGDNPRQMVLIALLTAQLPTAGRAIHR